MVIKFSSNTTNPPTMIYMGVDKVENEDLIKVNSKKFKVLAIKALENSNFINKN